MTNQEKIDKWLNLTFLDEETRPERWKTEQKPKPEPKPKYDPVGDFLTRIAQRKREEQEKANEPELEQPKQPTGLYWDSVDITEDWPKAIKQDASWERKHHKGNRRGLGVATIKKGSEAPKKQAERMETAQQLKMLQDLEASRRALEIKRQIEEVKKAKQLAKEEHSKALRNREWIIRKLVKNKDPKVVNNVQTRHFYGPRGKATALAYQAKEQKNIVWVTVCEIVGNKEVLVYDFGNGQDNIREEK